MRGLEVTSLDEVQGLRISCSFTGRCSAVGSGPALAQYIPSEGWQQRLGVHKLVVATLLVLTSVPVECVAFGVDFRNDAVHPLRHPPC